MSSISQHISPDLIRLERTSIIYDVTDIVFSLKQHIPPPGGLLLAEVSLVLHRSHGQSKYAVYLPTRRRMNRSSTFMESWRSCPTAFLLRSGECLPRHLVRIHFSRCARGFFAPHPLFVTFPGFERKYLQRNFELAENRLFATVHRLLRQSSYRTILAFLLFSEDHCFRVFKQGELLRLTSYVSANLRMAKGLMSRLSSVSYRPNADLESPVSSASLSSVQPFSTRKSFSRSATVNLMFISPSLPIGASPYYIMLLSISVDFSLFCPAFPSFWIYGRERLFSLKCACKQSTAP